MPHAIPQTHSAFYPHRLKGQRKVINFSPLIFLSNKLIISKVGQPSVYAAPISVNLARTQRALPKWVPHLRKSLRSAHDPVNTEEYSR